MLYLFTFFIPKPVMSFRLNLLFGKGASVQYKKKAYRISEFNFGSFRSDITHTLREAQVELHLVSQKSLILQKISHKI